MIEGFKSLKVKLEKIGYAFSLLVNFVNLSYSKIKCNGKNKACVQAKAVFQDILACVFWCKDFTEAGDISQYLPMMKTAANFKMPNSISE